MKYIKLFEDHQGETKDFSFEELSVDIEDVIKSFKGEFIPIKSFFGDLDFSNINYLNLNFEFNKILDVKNLRKSSVKDTKYFETFIKTPFKYLTLKNKGKNSIQYPDYIIIQQYKEIDKTQDCLLYKINGNFQGFYEKLSNKFVEVTRGDLVYIYRSNNKNTWVLTNQSPTKEFPSIIRKDDLISLIREE